MRRRMCSAFSEQHWFRNNTRLATIATIVLTLTLAATSLPSAAAGGGAQSTETPTATAAARQPRPEINPVSPETVVQPNPQRPARDANASSLPATGAGSTANRSSPLVAWVFAFLTLAAGLLATAWHALPRRAPG